MADDPTRMKTVQRKKRAPAGRSRGPRLTVTVSDTPGDSPDSSVLLKRSRTLPASPRPRKYKKTLHESRTVVDLRTQTLESKRTEMLAEEQLRDRLQKELDFLSQADSNLLHFDPQASSQEGGMPPATPGVSPSLPKKRRRKKSLKVAALDSDSGEEDAAPAPPPLRPTVISAAPLEESSLRVPVADAIALPPVLHESIALTPDLQAQAAKDAHTIQRILALKTAKLWTPKRIPRIPSPPRPKSHWDYVLAEMTWMANDFRQERRMKVTQAKRVSRAISRRQVLLQQQAERGRKEKQQAIRRVASDIAKQVQGFWSKIGTLVKHKHEARLEEKVAEARGRQLEFLVGQTERYSSKLAADLRESTSSAPTTGLSLSLSSSHESLSSSQHPPSSPDTPMEGVGSSPSLGGDVAPLSSPSSPPPPPAPSSTHPGGSLMEEDEEERKDIIHKAAEYATRHQPTGTTLSTTHIKTRVPELLRGSLREYQHIGLEWLVSMYEAKLNGILADEMGLGKTIMTIALLAYLAEHGIWGPHLIVVPTSVMLNWECEIKRFCPGLKVLTYYGTQKERKAKRQGWSKPNSFHVCITSYNLISQDRVMLSRKKWFYLILDEAQNIKNFRSQRWQVLLNFNTRRRLLLTGTPLQNNLMELWSLMHFLMPHIFQSHSDFKEWFCNPVNSMIEGASSLNEQLIARLHGVLRPFILRRLKKDVAKQLPHKYEHVVPCSLSKRQRYLYDEFMSRGKTQESLATGNYLSVLNVLMQLRKVCNHPDLFEERAISSPLQVAPLTWRVPALVWEESVGNYLSTGGESLLSRPFLVGALAQWEETMASPHEARSVHQLMPEPADLLALLYQQEREDEEQVARLIQEKSSQPRRRRRITHPWGAPRPIGYPLMRDDDDDDHAHDDNDDNDDNDSPGDEEEEDPAGSVVERYPSLQSYQERQRARCVQANQAHLQHVVYVSRHRARRAPVYGYALRAQLAVLSHSPLWNLHGLAQSPRHHHAYSAALLQAIPSYEQRFQRMRPLLDRYSCYIPPVQTGAPHVASGPLPQQALLAYEARVLPHAAPLHTLLHDALKHRQLALPEKRLVQFDCGKLQKLAVLLRDLRAGGHRVLIFTQMTRMLDILEIFLNLHAYTYMRLDGGTKPEQRQASMERFNADAKIFAFILSTRSGGCGVNLIGADTVIFYDSDWNPAMDAQAQDRCHRIGQTREVHIYRLISTQTIEENILKKANQKRLLDTVAIEGGQFTTDFFQSVDLASLMGGGGGGTGSSSSGSGSERSSAQSLTREQMQRAMNEVEDESDVLAMHEAQKELDQDLDEFGDTDPLHPSPAPPTGTSGALASSPAASSPSSSLLPADPDADETAYIKSRLNDIQRYAYRFLEEVEPIVDTEQMEELHEMVEDQAAQWKRDTLKRIRDTEHSMDQGDDQLYYEVEGFPLVVSQSFMEDHMLMYAPPAPPPPPPLPSSASLHHAASLPPPLSSPSFTGSSLSIPPKHLYIHPFDYDPPTWDDALFHDFPSLFEWIGKAPKRDARERRRKRPAASHGDPDQPDRKRLKTESDSDAPRPSPSTPSHTGATGARKKSRAAAGEDNLFNYRAIRKTATRGSRKKTHDDSTIIRVAFSAEEDQLIRQSVEILGANWELVSDTLNSSYWVTVHRTAAQCCFHYHNHLSPNKTTKKARKGSSAASSPCPESEYSADSRDLMGPFQSLSSLLHQVLAQRPQSPRRPPAELHPSHAALAESLALPSRVTPLQVFRSLDFSVTSTSLSQASTGPSSSSSSSAASLGHQGGGGPSAPHGNGVGPTLQSMSVPIRSLPGQPHPHAPSLHHPHPTSTGVFAPPVPPSHYPRAPGATPLVPGSAPVYSAHAGPPPRSVPGPFRHPPSVPYPPSGSSLAGPSSHPPPPSGTGGAPQPPTIPRFPPRPGGGGPQ